MIPASVRIFVCTRPQNLHRSFDGLAAAARQVLGQDPQSGALFVFTNRRRNRLKALWWDQGGYCVLYKRLHGALFRLPEPRTASESSVLIDGRGLAELLRGVRSMRKEVVRKAA